MSTLVAEFSSGVKLNIDLDYVYHQWDSTN